MEQEGMTMSRKVFIVNNGGHDYSDAERFGEITFCTDSVIRKDDIAQMYRELHVALDTARADDYLLVSSLTSLCMVAAAILADKFGELHLLLFKDGHYVDRDLILDPLL
jgi:hypothetical protein